MTPQPDPIDGFLAMVTERIDALTGLKTAVEKCRALDLLGQADMPTAVTVVVESAVVAPAPRALARPKKEPVMPPRTGRGGRGRIDRAGLEPLIVAYLDRQTKPSTMAALVAAVKSYPAPARKILDRMVEAGEVVRTGTRVSMRLGRPAVMNGGAPVAVLKPAKARAVSVRSAVSGPADALIEALDAKFASGASYTVEECFRA